MATALPLPLALPRSALSHPDAPQDAQGSVHPLISNMRGESGALDGQEDSERSGSGRAEWIIQDPRGGREQQQWAQRHFPDHEIRVILGPTACPPGTLYPHWLQITMPQQLGQHYLPLLQSRMGDWLCCCPRCPSWARCPPCAMPAVLSLLIELISPILDLP